MHLVEIHIVTNNAIRIVTELVILRHELIIYALVNYSMISLRLYECEHLSHLDFVPLHTRVAELSVIKRN